MKKIISFLVCFGLSFSVFAQPADRTLSKIPLNTPIMVSFNFSHFLDKVSTDQIKSYEMVQYGFGMMKQNAGKDSVILNTLYKKPKSYGLEVLPSAVLFVSYDTTLPTNKMISSPLVGLSVPLSSGKKFEKLLVQTMKEKYVDFVEKKEGYKVYINRDFGMAWDKKNLVFVGGNKKTIDENITKLMTLPTSGSVLNDAEVKRAISHKGDICSGIDVQPVLEIFQKVMKEEMGRSKKNKINFFDFYDYKGGASFGVFDFADGAIELKSESVVDEKQREFAAKLSKESVNSTFANYLPEGKVYGGISVASNVSLLKEYFEKEGKGVYDSMMVYVKKEGVKKLVKEDSAIIALKEGYWADSTTWDQRKEIDEKVEKKSEELYEETLAKVDHKVDSTLAEYGLTMENAWGVFKGDLLVAMTGTKEIVDTFKTYDYIENEEGEYEYLEVEKTKLQKIPAFRSFMTLTDKVVFQRVLDSLVSKKKLIKSEDGRYKFDVPQLNLSLAVQGNVLCFSNDVDFMQNYFIKGKKEENALTGEAKDLLFNYNTSMFMDIEGITDLLGEDAKKGSLAMFTEMANDNFSKIIMTSKVTGDKSYGVFKLGMKSERNSFLQLMDLANETFLKFSGKRF